MEDIEVDEACIRKLLQKTNPRKATGPDSIPACILKDCASELAPILTIILNKSLQKGKVPEDWRHANVTRDGVLILVLVLILTRVLFFHLLSCTLYLAKFMSTCTRTYLSTVTKNPVLMSTL